MTEKFDPYQPTARNCIGRDTLAGEILASALNRRCVLLFGGRQSGKTTLLLKIAADLSKSVSVDMLDNFTCPVYVDLTRLPTEAQPSDFFDLLIRVAITACAKEVSGYDPSNITTVPCATIEIFAKQIQSITSNAGNIDLTLLFLLDESERVLGERFPRGFQDNLFSILYGPELANKLKIGIIFSGSQALYKFSEDETSPIGSRAAYIYLENLPLKAMSAFLSHLKSSYGLAIDENLGQVIHGLCDGHPGLLGRLSLFVQTHQVNSVDSLNLKIEHFRKECRQLFRLWASSLSMPARVVHDSLALTASLSRHELIALFVSRSWDPLHVERAIEEVTFTGIGRYEDERLLKSNTIYWNYIQDYISASAKTGTTVHAENFENQHRDEIWGLIEKVEISLRSYVALVYKRVFGEKLQKKLGEVLGPAAMAKVLSNVEKSNKRYKYTEREEVLDVFDGLYLGQLGQLITSKDAWPSFSEMTQDKRELELMLGPINAVRTDKAHFYKVPLRELTRCKLNCEDLIGIIEKLLPKGAV